ncbi:MAG: J domain-containing protein [Candidatus Omnitrophica bacterium]|nr:J domain-containing protein [Candidatus Omnitrophota bacterium]
MKKTALVIAMIISCGLCYAGLDDFDRSIGLTGVVDSDYFIRQQEQLDKQQQQIQDQQYEQEQNLKLQIERQQQLERDRQIDAARQQQRIKEYESRQKEYKAPGSKYKDASAGMLERYGRGVFAEARSLMPDMQETIFYTGIFLLLLSFVLSLVGAYKAYVGDVIFFANYRDLWISFAPFSILIAGLFFQGQLQLVLIAAALLGMLGYSLTMSIENNKFGEVNIFYLACVVFGRIIFGYLMPLLIGLRFLFDFERVSAFSDFIDTLMSPKVSMSQVQIEAMRAELETEMKSRFYIDREQSERSPNEVLDVPFGASAEEIDSAYKRRILHYHPSRTAYLNKELKDFAARRTEELTRAYQQLINRMK